MVAFQFNKKQKQHSIAKLGLDAWTASQLQERGVALDSTKAASILDELCNLPIGHRKVLADQLREQADELDPPQA
jgi:hypothetical protein